MGEDLFEFEGEMTRGEAASYFEELAADLDAGSVTVSDGETELTVTLPDRLTFEIELEREPTEPAEIELEIELEWTEGDTKQTDLEARSGTDVSAEDDSEADPTVDETDGADETNETDGSGGSGGSGGRFEVYRDRAGKWRWRMRNRNGELVASSQTSYDSDEAAEAVVADVMRDAADAAVDIEDDTG